MSNQYQDKIDRILTAMEHKEPDHVPIMANIGTWALSYSGITVREIEENPELEIEAFSKPYEDIYADSTLTVGLVFDSVTNSSIGSEMHFVSEDGMTIQHHENVTMEDDEYPKLIEDPIGFMFNELVPRRAKRLQKYPESYEAVKEFMEHWKVKMPMQQALTETLKNDYQMPVMCGANLHPPMDFIFDYFRGFRGVSMDMRRRPEELKEAVEALLPFAKMMLGIPPGTQSVPQFPFYFTMMHAPTFINPKQFGKFFWPTYLEMLHMIKDLGGKVLINMEGTWESKYDYINEIPKDLAICMLESDDIFEAKKRIGDNVTIAGGMPLGMLKYSSKQECIDYAKRLVDECAPGGGFLFSTDRHLLTGGDVNTENLIAVHDFVHNYK